MNGKISIGNLIRLQIIIFNSQERKMIFNDNIINNNIMGSVDIFTFFRKSPGIARTIFQLYHPGLFYWVKE